MLKTSVARSFSDAVFITAWVIFLFSVSCSTADKKEESASQEVKNYYEIVCPDTVNLRDKKTDRLLSSGPVKLPEGKSCSELKSLDSKAIGKLARHGVWTIYNDDGKIIRTSTYADGKKDGEEILYFPSSGQWRAKGPFRDNARNGLWKERFTEKDTCESEGMYKDDKKEGKWTECAQDEKQNAYKSLEANYSGGLKNGPAVSFYPSGAVNATGSYSIPASCRSESSPDPVKCSIRTGHWQIFHDAEKADAKGPLAMEGSYNSENGLRTGVWTEYYKNGKKMAQGPRNHTRNGKWTFWDKNGVILYEFEFKGNDFKPEYGVLYENGKKTAEGPLSQGLVQYKADTDELAVKSLIQSGNWKLYTNGALTAEGEMMVGKKNGQWRELEGGKWVVREYMMGKVRTSLIK